MNLKNKKVFVTGADGFIGSHLVEALVHECREVRALALYNSFGTYGWLDQLNSEALAAIDIHLGDIRDRSLVGAAIQGCDVVFHLAALIAIPYSYSAPESYVDTNVGEIRLVIKKAYLKLILNILLTRIVKTLIVPK